MTVISKVASVAANVIKGATVAAAAYGGINAAAALYNTFSLVKNSQPTNTDLVFPSDLINKFPDGQSYFIALKFSKYVKPGIYDPPVQIFQSGIKLPIPAKLSVDTGLNYSDVSLGSALGAAVEAAKGTVDQGLTTQGSLNILSGAASGAAVSGASALVNNLNTKAGPALSIASGIAINPFLSVLFDSTKFRNYSFSWKLFPKNITESNTIKNIINTINQNILPKLPSGQGLFFTYPNILEISFNTPDQNSYLFSFKKAVVKDFSVNYAATNEPAFFRGSSAPAAVEITMAIQEIEMWQSDDYSF